MRRAVSRMHARKYIGRTHARTLRYCEKPCMARVKPRARLDSRVWKWRAVAIVWKWIASPLAAEATTVTNWLSSDLPAASLPACLPTGLVMSLSRKRQEPRSVPRKIGRATHNAATSQTPENAAASASEPESGRLSGFPPEEAARNQTDQQATREEREREKEREGERGREPGRGFRVALRRDASFFSRGKTGVRARGV